MIDGETRHAVRDAFTVYLSRVLDCAGDDEGVRRYRTQAADGDPP